MLLVHDEMLQVEQQLMPITFTVFRLCARRLIRGGSILFWGSGRDLVRYRFLTASCDVQLLTTTERLRNGLTSGQLIWDSTSMRIIPLKI